MVPFLNCSRKNVASEQNDDASMTLAWESLYLVISSWIYLTCLKNSRGLIILRQLPLIVPYLQENSSHLSRGQSVVHEREEVVG